MRFSADLTEYGWRNLEKGFLPALEKQGRTCSMLLGTEEVLMVQTLQDTDGVHVTARLAVDRTFDPATYTIASKHQNFIAFNLDISQLLGVLRAARANKATQLSVRLTQKRTPVPGRAELTTTILRFQGKGDNINVVQELPISKPYTPAAVDELVSRKDPALMSSFYLDVQPSTSMLQGMLDKMKSISDSVMLAVTKHGDLYVHVSGLNVMLATQLQSMAVFPPQDVEEPNRATSAEQQLQDALDTQMAVAVNLPIKHLARTLAAEGMTQPTQLLFGIVDDQSAVHVMFVYRDTSTDQVYDDSLALSFMLPVTLD